MKLKLQIFLFSFILNFTGESDVIGSHEPVKATLGRDVILPCHLEPPFNVSTLTVEWKQDAKQVHLYRSWKDHLVGQDKNFKDRTSLFHEEMSRGNISLKLTNVTKQDAGNYTCFVPRLDKRGRVTLTVVHGEEHISTPADGPGIVTGIVIVGILVIAGLAGIGLFVWMRRRKTEQNAGDGGGRQHDREDSNQVNIPLKDLGDNADN